MDQEERIAHAERRLRELLEKGATLDDVLNGPEGHAWRVYPSARQLEL